MLFRLVSFRHSCDVVQAARGNMTRACRCVRPTGQSPSREPCAACAMQRAVRSAPPATLRVNPCRLLVRSSCCSCFAYGPGMRPVGSYYMKNKENQMKSSQQGKDMRCSLPAWADKCNDREQHSRPTLREPGRQLTASHSHLLYLAKNGRQ